MKQGLRRTPVPASADRLVRLAVEADEVPSGPQWDPVEVNRAHRLSLQPRSRWQSYPCHSFSPLSLRLSTGRATSGADLIFVRHTLYWPRAGAWSAILGWRLGQMPS